MANLKDSPHFQVYDDYYTPKSAWERINTSIPKDKVIWEACMLGAELSKSNQYLEELGCKVIADKTMNCLENQPEEWDMIVTNIPFDKTKKIPILERFVELDKPFIVIMNSMNTFTKYFHKVFKGKEKHLQVITPSSKINFDKLEGGKLNPTKNCSFYSCYVCYKVELPAEQLWID
jgi:hypothetical protein